MPRWELHVHHFSANIRYIGCVLQKFNYIDKIRISWFSKDCREMTHITIRISMVHYIQQHVASCSDVERSIVFNIFWGYIMVYWKIPSWVAVELATDWWSCEQQIKVTYGYVSHVNRVHLEMCRQLRDWRRVKTEKTSWSCSRIAQRICPNSFGDPFSRFYFQWRYFKRLCISLRLCIFEMVFSAQKFWKNDD